MTKDAQNCWAAEMLHQARMTKIKLLVPSVSEHLKSVKKKMTQHSVKHAPVAVFLKCVVGIKMNIYFKKKLLAIS